jgi:outer membrane protein assembly factor BamB
MTKRSTLVHNGCMLISSVQRTRHSLRSAPLVAALALLSFGVASAQVDVLTQHNNLSRTGVNLHEPILTPTDVNQTGFGMLFKRVLDDQLYTQPLLVTGIAVDGGTHDIVYVTTVNNSVYAFDANDPEATAPIWHVNFGTPANLHSTDFGCLDMNGQMGIVGTPVIDKARGVLYVVALSKTGNDTYTQRLHELDLASGADLPESPVVIKADGFDALMQNQRPGLALANGMVYIGYASHCDKQPYHGYMMAYDAKTLAQTAVFNTSPTTSENAIWQSGLAPAVDSEGNLYIVTGNGTWDGVKNFSESFLKLSPQLKLLDWFTPSNHEALDKGDADLNSSGATLIPGTHLVIGGGKQGVIYSLDARNLGHLGDEHAVQHFQATVSHLHSVVYWVSDKKGPLLYMWGQRDRAKVYELNGEKFTETPSEMRDTPNQGHPGSMLSLSADGGKDGILWSAIHATGDSWHESRPGILHAFEANDIRHELWNSLEDASRDDCGEYSKMAPPTIANGHVYLASFGHENIGTGQFCVYGLLPAKDGAKLASPAGGHAEVKNKILTLTWSPVVGAEFYRVLRSGTLDPEPKTLATGLTTPTFSEPAPSRGETANYTVVAVGTNGVSTPSQPITITSTPGPKPQH